MKLAVVADEVTAVGWRLAGARVLIPDARNVEECFHTALSGADVVFITAELAAAVSARQLQEALHAQPPLVLVIPDLRGGREPPDTEAETRRALGVTL
jgi:vacuolar-type H+-ATPase subunit F/Vma7